MKKYEINIGSPIEYEELVEYIRIFDKPIALVQMEEGKDRMKVEFFEESLNERVDLTIFIEALQEAKRELEK
ncbi:hypothetical protein QNI19_12270 [Cytophagaceae bacterium DM2B3-1]|uniref:DUF4911 domain-containing protein n=1 Tax=Xanthocytophaga flava TaxID=3048013 RepID=A0ABT7CJ00_9BACT|nr:hypothetical protein [Xanthocytophaga flavus]MDJ1493709.1 hypothetical protein [Xanthocytophaga flavus]